MFDFLFGWRKASKCKKLIMRVQCRLKLLRNKRSCIVKQLRLDVAELLKNGHHRTAFDWVEKVLLDGNMVQVYDLLYQCCEVVVIKLPYIRKHRDCPGDINEAISTLIFSSSRFGNLPELLPIRDLFRQRYGPKFVSTALQLLPGNLVKHQIIENLDMKKVPDDTKYKLLDEIAQSYIQTEDKKYWKEFEEEVIYVDEIEELMSKDGNLQDQRLFMFKSFGMDLNSKTNDGINEDREEAASSSSRKRSRSLHQESLNAGYYGEWDETPSSPEITRRFDHRNQSHPKLPDYDELAAKFMDLKRLNLQKTRALKTG